MFVLELTYTAPVDRVDALAADHHAWVDASFAVGAFLLSGRKQPRDGGVILAVGDDRAAVEGLIATDPFVVGGVCAYRITEFVVGRTAPGLAQYREARPPH
ncbi:YciI family protein [Streptomyces sp. NBC_01511]|uniref:YciI family protein n=1 Tax=unclassified Streptomyces TaxID=2593676 RepID=UPI00386838AD